VERLAQDHRNAKLFAEQIARLSGIRLQGDAVETNLVFFDVQQTGRDAPGIARRLEARGVRIGVESKYVMRAVFHLDIDLAGTQSAVAALQEALDQSSAT
jgi:threonine aldolase